MTITESKPLYTQLVTQSMQHAEPATLLEARELAEDQGISASNFQLRAMLARVNGYVLGEYIANEYETLDSGYLLEENETAEEHRAARVSHWRNLFFAA